MKMIPLGTAAARPAPATTVPTEQQAQEAPPILYAAVLDRDRDGIVTRLHLPGPTAKGSVPLLSPTEDGSWIQSGWVANDGSVRVTPDLVPDIPAGTKLLAPTDPRGRVLLVQVMVRQTPSRAPSRPTLRSAPPPSLARSADPYAHDPREVLIAGIGGGVLRVR
jgi:hypothetical protein